MAEAVLYHVAGEIIMKLGSQAFQEIGLWWHAKEELENLKNTVTTIQAVLLDAEEQQKQNNQVRDWLGKLKDAVYDADDLLDDFSTEALRRGVITGNETTKKVDVKTRAWFEDFKHYCRIAAVHNINLLFLHCVFTNCIITGPTSYPIPCIS